MKKVVMIVFLALISLQISPFKIIFNDGGKIGVDDMFANSVFPHVSLAYNVYNADCSSSDYEIAMPILNCVFGLENGAALLTKEFARSYYYDSLVYQQVFSILQQNAFYQNKEKLFAVLRVLETFKLFNYEQIVKAYYIEKLEGKQHLEAYKVFNIRNVKLSDFEIFIEWINKIICSEEQKLSLFRKKPLRKNILFMAEYLFDEYCSPNSGEIIPEKLAEFVALENVMRSCREGFGWSMVLDEFKVFQREKGAFGPSPSEE
ncbi:TPA: hypothetical protein DEO28_00065 [Candidatus Dependentiae bacterium]|nr:MAG: hypothetical protein UR14_C0001G0129 [candidate division TM6 bacterium GW2011_GWE2_31_21]KKP53991.1 MAG: hypothetical protein UR43_C0001G0009 [candidate division TM6 bacterium GW2011_GWF2_33_332]HBS48428.1 hypothetical protein [Candidatus Dependentiae bacterium]HBZ72898.1 hypothetical protein [Candidatus Dependentiae bacterium]